MNTNEADYNITLFEACELLNKSKKTLSRYIRRGRLNPLKVKSQQGTLEYRFTKTDLESLRAELAIVDTQDRTDETEQTGQTRQDTPQAQTAPQAGTITLEKEPLTTRSIRRIIEARLKAVGLKTSKVTAHSLRHTAGTIALMNGADLIAVKEMLRHSNVNTTLIYTHNLNRLEKGAEKFIAF